MRTTLTLDEDVATALDRLRVARGTSFRLLVNELLRAGLERMQVPEPPYRIKPVDLGASRMDLDNIAEVLAVAEGEDWR